MPQLNVTLPPQLKQWVDARVAEGRFSSASDYVRDLLRRDQDAALSETEWLRGLIQEGLASGVSDQDPFEFLDELRAGKHDRKG